jgi:hypothetical protein
LGIAREELLERAEKNAPPRHYENPAKLMLGAHLARQSSGLHLPATGEPVAEVPEMDAALFWEKMASLPHYHGDEHDVWLDTELYRAVKVTKTFAMKHGLASYVRRVAKVNATFDDDITVEGWLLDHAGQVQVVTSQPWVHGRPSTTVEMDDLMRRKGFLKAMDGIWHRDQDDLWMGDVFNDPKEVDGKQRCNVITDPTGHVAVIDAIVPQLSERQSERLLDLIEKQPQPTPPPLV